MKIEKSIEKLRKSENIQGKLSKCCHSRTSLLFIFDWKEKETHFREEGK